MNDGKVYGMAILGTAATSVDSLISNLGPLLDILVRLGQIGVAAVTILYIYSKWKAIRASKKDDNEDPS